MTRWKDAAPNALLVAFLLAAMAYPYRNGNAAAVFERAQSISDFSAFYCGALVLREGGNPYLLAPLRACQVQYVYAPAGTTAEQHHGVDPAPQPPYTLAIYEPLTLLPYRIAGLIWLALLLASTLAGAACLARLTGLPYWAALAFLEPGAFACYVYGQTQPFVTLALLGAALLLRSDRGAWAALALTPTLINPQVGIAAMGGLLVWSPASRTMVVALGLAATGLSLWAGGAALNLTYFTRALPAQAFAETNVPFQYSLTSLLSALGIADKPAMLLGSLQYVALLAVGVLCAGAVARRTGCPAIVLFPPACAVVGGLYIHGSQAMSAVPFALYLATTEPASALAWAGAALVALLWPATREGRWMLPAEAAILFTTVNAIAHSYPGRTRALIAAAAFALYCAFGPIQHHIPSTPLRPAEPPNAAIAAGYDPALASTEDAAAVRSDPIDNGATPAALYGRTPTWLGLLTILAATLAPKRRPPA